MCFGFLLALWWMNLICEKSTGNSCSTIPGGKPCKFSRTCRTWAVLVWWKVGQPVTDWDIYIWDHLHTPGRVVRAGLCSGKVKELAEAYGARNDFEFVFWFPSNEIQAQVTTVGGFFLRPHWAFLFSQILGCLWSKAMPLDHCTVLPWVPLVRIQFDRHPSTFKQCRRAATCAWVRNCGPSWTATWRHYFLVGPVWQVAQVTPVPGSPSWSEFHDFGR